MALLRRLWTRRPRCFPRPVLLSGVLACVFYQTLVLLRGRLKSAPPAAPRDNASAETRFEELLLLQQPERLVPLLEVWLNQTDVDKAQQNQAGWAGRAVVLIGQHLASHTEVQLYQRVLQQHGYSVSLDRYAETSTVLRQDTRPGSRLWAVLICLRGSEKSCHKRATSYHIQAHQQVNVIAGITWAFSDAGGTCRFWTDSQVSGMALPIIPSACKSPNSQPRGDHSPINDDRSEPETSPGRPSSRGFVATVTVYVLVTSLSPLMAFLHSTGLVRLGFVKHGHATKLQAFFLKRLGSDTYLQPLDNMKEAIGTVLLAAAISSEGSVAPVRCQLCFQLMTFTLHFSGSLVPKIIKVHGELHFVDLEDPGFEGQILKEFILEDALNLLLQSNARQNRVLTSFLGTESRIRQEFSGGCTGGLCLSPGVGSLLLHFFGQLERRGPFEVLYPNPSVELSGVQLQLSQMHQRARRAREGTSLTVLLDQALFLLVQQHQNRLMSRADDSDMLRSRNLTKVTQNSQHRTGETRPHLYFYITPSRPSGVKKCKEPSLRQLYTSPQLTLTPPFSPHVKEYRTEVPFDVVTVKIRAEPASCHCQVHLDERRGPRVANYPIGLGNSRVSILVVDDSDVEPVIVTVYTLHIFRESRPSLPVFEEYTICGFLQDCGLVVRPSLPCGLEPIPQTPSSGHPQASTRPCESGDAPGRWVVPCLSCSDNRTCDWRMVSWQPHNCYYPLMDGPQLQKCMKERKVMFIGDSTNRGMMYYFMERVNGTLEEWGKAHDTLVYHDVNNGSTLISYSYYPQFWLGKEQRPTFEAALRQLIQRTRPLKNSPQTVLVAGGVQWLNVNHLKILQQVLKREDLLNISVVVKSLGMGFHLPVDGVHSLSQTGVQDLFSLNENILAAAKLYGYEVIDTLSITMGRYKEFLQGRCACHFHEVGKFTFSTTPQHRKMKLFRHAAATWSGPGEALALWELDSRAESPYHVRGPVNEVYSEILLSRMCASN
ncbi:cadherin-like and PC-esterase domain-containing protein 1 [Arapaima gigas]